VRPRRAGRMVYYTLDDQHIVGLFEQGLEHVEERMRPLARGSLEPRAPGVGPRRREESRAPRAVKNASGDK